MFGKIFNRNEMTKGVLFITVEKDDVKDYYAKTQIVGLAVGRYTRNHNRRYVIDSMNKDTRWVNDDHTVARIGVECEKQAFEKLKNLEFVNGGYKEEP